MRGDKADVSDMKGANSMAGSKSSSHYINRVVNKMVQIFQEEAGHLDEEMQQQILCKFVHHPSMSAAYNSERLLGGDSLLEVMTNLRSSLQMVKGSHSNDQLAAKNAVLSMVVSGSEGTKKKMKNGKAVASLLGVHKRNFKKASERKTKIMNADGLWADGLRQLRSNRASKEVVDMIEAFWSENTRVSPNKKDVRRKKLGKGKDNFITHPTHYLEIPQVEMFLQFKEAYPDACVGQKLFEKYKPFYVKKLKERNTCCCVRHVQLDLLRLSLNSMREISEIHKECRCDCIVCEWKEGMQTCLAAKKTFSRLHELWEMAVCPKADGAEWHNLTCILGACTQCGVDKIKFCPKELEEAGPFVDWKVYEDVKNDAFSMGAAATCPSHTRDVKRYFWEVKIDDVNRREAWDCKTVEGTRKIHSIRGINKVDPTRMMTRQFACFCTFCMYGDIHQCENIKQIGSWAACVLEPLHGRSGYNLREHVEDIDDHIPLADLVCAGTIFAVEAPADNKEGDVFWLVLCSVPKHTLTEDIVDPHGNRFAKGDEVLEGKYYKKYEGNRDTNSGTTSYTFGGKDSNVIVWAEQVIHIIVDMPHGHQVKGKRTVYLLGAADEEKILEKLV